MEEIKISRRTPLEFLLARTGKYYHLVIILLTQVLITYPTLALGSILIQTNTGFSAEQSAQTAVAAVVLITVGNIAVAFGLYYFNRDISTRLEQWKAGRAVTSAQSELNAWRQVTSMSWRYGAGAMAAALLIGVVLLLYLRMALGADDEQLIYMLLGGIALGVVIITSTVLVVEIGLRPVRKLLLPATFESQLTGISGFRIRQRFLVFILSLVIFSILLIAPFAYKQVTTAINYEINSEVAKYNLQSGSIFASVTVLVLGTVLAFFLSQSVSSPVQELIQTFTRVEQGDLKERADIVSTDEIGELAVYFNRMLYRIEELQQNLQHRVDEQTEKLRASNEVGRIASTILDPDVLISRVVNLISRTFDYYYVALFIVIEGGRWAEIRDATGTAGEILKSRRHRLQVGGNSMVGSAISSREAQVAMDVGEAAVRFNNPLLPNTRSELALPLLAGDRVIGALDVQSTREADFRPEDISTLQNMANQVAIAIENARLFKEMNETLDELRQANSQYLLSAWSDKLQSGTLEYSIKSPSIPASEETKDIEVGLNVRDQSIGQIRLQTEGEWTHEDQNWVEALATQVAISLENARLIEESQQSALRERLSASIVQKLWASTSIDSILQTAVRELGRALEVSEATIELKVDD